VAVTRTTSPPKNIPVLFTVEIWRFLLLSSSPTASTGCVPAVESWTSTMKEVSLVEISAGVLGEPGRTIEGRHY